MILNSDLDQLRIHAAGAITLSGYKTAPDDPGYTYDPVSVAFADLGYIPFGQFGISRVNKAVQYPLVSTALNQLDEEPYYIPVKIFQDHFVWEGIGYWGAYSQFRLTYLILKNEIERD